MTTHAISAACDRWTKRNNYTLYRFSRHYRKGFLEGARWALRQKKTPTLRQIASLDEWERAVKKGRKK